MRSKDKPRKDDRKPFGKRSEHRFNNNKGEDKKPRERDRKPYERNNKPTNERSYNTDRKQATTAKVRVNDGDKQTVMPKKTTAGSRMRSRKKQQ